AISQQLVTGSFDPNDKLARSSSGSSTTYVIGQDEWIDYTIRFQNTGTDTAFNVLITDTLPTTLDPATVQWGPTSHSCTRSMASNGTLKFLFTNILLPDSNANEAASHGFVNFRIRPRNPVLPGITIENTANIYFDFNPPVITEPSVLVAEFSTGVAELIGVPDMVLLPNPTDGMLTVCLRDDSFAGGWLRVLAMDGRLVFEERVTSNKIDLDLSALASGPYTIHIISPQDLSIGSRVTVH
ncbi:MAG TPA: hypothetical protein PKJ19_12255, partial [Flavobacteriales bacterium]|nr:hypothetical protein [Flavobacteriales bacterium]